MCPDLCAIEQTNWCAIEQIDRLRAAAAGSKRLFRPLLCYRALSTRANSTLSTLSNSHILSLIRELVKGSHNIKRLNTAFHRHDLPFLVFIKPLFPQDRRSPPPRGSDRLQKCYR